MDTTCRLSPPPNTSAGVKLLCGGVSVLFVGYGSDRLGRMGRAQIITAGLALAAIVLLLLGSAGGSRLTVVSVALVGLVAVLVIGPYSYLAGALSLDFGGKRGAIAAESPEFDRYGVHVLIAQHGDGELVIGDSHEYRRDIEPFDKPNIDTLILDYLDRFLVVPDLRIAARWHGIYVKHPEAPFLVLHPTERVTAVTGVGGNGMTLSFGLAERVVREAL